MVYFIYLVSCFVYFQFGRYIISFKSLILCILFSLFVIVTGMIFGNLIYAYLYNNSISYFWDDFAEDFDENEEKMMHRFGEASILSFWLGFAYELNSTIFILALLQAILFSAIRLYFNVRDLNK